MAKLTGQSLISSIDLYKAVTTPEQAVGAIMWDGNTGKTFRYSLNGAVALVKGNLLQEAAEDTQFENMAIGTAALVGDAFLQVTNGSTTVVPTQYIGGSIGVYTAGTVAVGDEYTITGVTGTLTTGGALNVYTDRPVRYAYSTAAKVVMKPSPFAGVIQFPVTTQTGMPVGIAIYEIPASTATVFQYGWVQTHGAATALSDNSTFAVGSGLVPSLAVAGAVGVNVAGTTHTPIGVAREAAASTHGISIFLNID